MKKFLVPALCLLIITMAYGQKLPVESRNTVCNFTEIKTPPSDFSLIIEEPTSTQNTETALPLNKDVRLFLEELIRDEESGWRTTKVQAETGAYLSHRGISQGGSLPFWFRTNQYGIVPAGPVAGVLRGSIHTGYRSAARGSGFDNLDFGYGAEVVVNTTGRNWQLLVPEAYVKMRLGPFELYGGRRRETMGLMDTLLTSGSYAWSGNTLPIPKFDLSIPEYWPTRSFVGVKGSYSHGYFENSRPYSSGVRLHQKSLYVRLGKPGSLFRLYGGMNHQVQWAGNSPFFSLDGKLPSSLEAYLYVITAKSVAGDSLRFGNNFDGGNRVGNHLGSVDGALEINFDRSSLLVYRQSIYEDGSLFYLTNLADGLNGISWQHRTRRSSGASLQRLTLEYLHTMSQGGDVYTDLDNNRGRDQYFNHAQYRDGWSYFGRTIGTPFITPRAEFKEGSEPYGDYFTSNNRVQVWHLGAAGRFSPAVSFLGKVSYSRNAGTYDAIYTPRLTQWSAYLDVGADLGFWRGVRVSGAMGWDQGLLLNDALGLNLRIRKTWVDKYRREAAYAR